MKSSYVSDVSRRKLTVSDFGGYNRNLRIGENEFYDMKNMSGRHYPLLSARAARGDTLLPEGGRSMVICNTYGTSKDDVDSRVINEDVFAICTEDADGDAWVDFGKLDGSDPKGAYCIGGDASSTTLIAQAGFVYAFPQNYRIGTYDSGKTGPLANEVTVLRTAERDSLLLKPSALFTMSPSDGEGRTGNGITATRTLDGEYSDESSDTRGTDQLILVKKSGLSVNENGYTVYVDSLGAVKKIVKWTAETIDLAANEAAFALTGHGKAREWLSSAVSVGDNIEISGDRVNVYASGAYIVVYQKPDSPVNGTVWHDKPNGRKYVWSSAFNEWQSYTTNYILLSYEEVGAGNFNEVLSVKRNGEVDKNNDGSVMRLPFKGFKEGDCIKIGGITEEADGYYVISSITDRGLILNGVINDIYQKPLSEIGDRVTINRSIPKMDFVIESGNRLWGCYYGVNEDGEVINEIYASALGDPTNWYRYQGISTDSWTATVGADGPFTGAVVYDSTPIFFKESCIIRIFGDYPPYTAKRFNYRGVRKGSERSIAVCNEILYYHSYDGILAYNGSPPVKVDSALGDMSYKCAVGGAIKNNYYVSMEDCNGEHSLFVYNTDLGLWHREDDIAVRQFLRVKDELFFIDGNGYVKNTEGEDEKSLEWYAITGVIGYGDADEKLLCALQARVYIPIGSFMSFAIEYDEDGVWHPLATIDGRGNLPFVYKMNPRRCDRYRLKISGIGDGRVISLTHVISPGSDNALRGGRL